MKSLSRRLRAQGLHAEYAVLCSVHGHDGFLIEWDALAPLLLRALALPPGVGRDARISSPAGVRARKTS